MSIVNELEAIIPIKDTWETRRYKDITWFIEPNFDFSSISSQDVNSWFADSLIRTLDAFSTFVRIERATFGTDYTQPDSFKPISLEWNHKLSQEEYVKSVVSSIQNYQAPIYELTLNAEILVYVRTQESPTTPVLGWVKDLVEFDFYGGSEYGNPSITLKLNTTLFCPDDDYDEIQSNKELHELNHPQLSASLCLWEEAFCAELIPDGPGKMYKYGFLS